jgi:hypothetical protein
MFEHLNWLIFLVVAALSAVVGFFAILRIWANRLPDEITGPDWGALHGWYALVVAVVVEVCSVVLDVWRPDGIRMQWISVIGYGGTVALLIVALVAIHRVRHDLAFQVRIACWLLLAINLTGGALFLISEMKT